MEQVIVYRGSSEFVRLNGMKDARGIESAEQIREKMGQDVVKIDYVSSKSIKFKIGDYIEVFGERYALLEPPIKYEKQSEKAFSYDLEFKGKIYQLGNTAVLNFDSLAFSTGGTFSLMGNLNDFAELIIRNLNRVEPGVWELGEVETDIVEHQLLGFTDNNCLQILQDICNKYNTEFYIVRTGPATYRLDIKPKSNILPNIFKYGRARGLYNLTREFVSNKAFATRLFAYGSTKNIPLSYRSGSLRLKMPISLIHSEGQPYIEDAAAVAAFGVREISMTFEDIFPTYTGTVSAVSSDPLMFYDSIFPFNLMESSGGTSTYLLPGTSAKIVFKSGNLNGYEFEVSAYNHTERKFKINTYTDESGTVFPDGEVLARKINIGDTYTIYDIQLPSSYITSAEMRLYNRAKKELEKMVNEPIKYKLSVDPFYITRLAPPDEIINYFEVGDRIKAYDEDLGLDGNLPIQSFTRDLLEHYRYEITLGDIEINTKRKQFFRNFGLNSVIYPNIDVLLRPRWLGASGSGTGLGTASATAALPTMFIVDVEEDTMLLEVDGIFPYSVLAYIEIDGVVVNVARNGVVITDVGLIDFSSIGGVFAGQNIVIRLK